MPPNMGKIRHCDNSRVPPYRSTDCSADSSVALDEYGVFRSITTANCSFAGSSNVGTGFSKGDMVEIKTRVMLFPKFIEKDKRRI